MRRCDAVLLEFAPDEWRQPYLTATYQPVLPRMLALHDIYGDGTEDFDDEDKPNAMRDAVEREKATLALPTPEHWFTAPGRKSRARKAWTSYTTPRRRRLARWARQTSSPRRRARCSRRIRSACGCGFRFHGRCAISAPSRG